MARRAPADPTRSRLDLAHRPSTSSTVRVGASAGAASLPPRSPIRSRSGPAAASRQEPDGGFDLVRREAAQERRQRSIFASRPRRRRDGLRGRDEVGEQHRPSCTRPRGIVFADPCATTVGSTRPGRNHGGEAGLAFGLAALLAVGVGVAIFASVAGGKTTAEPNAHRSSTVGLTVVRGVIGSEKQPFFADRRVQGVFRAHGFDVQVDTAGSRQIASTVDLSQYGFAFPAGVPAAAKIDRRPARHTVRSPRSTRRWPIASWKPIAQLLVQAGVAKDQGGYYTFDVAKYLDLVKKNTRWTDLPGNTAYPANKSVLVTSTDVRTSNSAAMYLSIASYVANQNNVVQNEQPGRRGPADGRRRCSSGRGSSRRPRRSRSTTTSRSASARTRWS